jgi:hypothetical protein
MTSATPGVIDVAAELDALGVHYGCADAVRHFVERARPWLAGYAEVVLGEDSFEVVTGGVGASAVSAMAGLGAALSDETRAHFAAAAARFSGVMVGVKVGFGVAVSPTLYLRCKCPVDDALAFVASDFGEGAAAELAVVFANNDVCYGFGFVDADDGTAALKTYALVRGAGRQFVSWRLKGGRLQAEHKLYDADVAIDAVSQLSRKWCDHVDFFTHTLHWRVASNLGRVEGGSGRAVKVYVERIGAIATDVEAV